MLSVVRAAQFSCKNTQLGLFRQTLNNLKGCPNNIGCGGQILRQMGHGRTMPMQPSKFEWTKFKDHIHFYVLLGVIPLGLATTYANIFIGKATLAELPEDRMPEEYEYYRYPQTRWLLQTFWPRNSEQRHYEINLFHLSNELRKKELRILEAKVKKLQQQRGDYKAWYYVPVNSDRNYTSFEHAQKNKRDLQAMPGSGS